jgi:HSP20 family protein
MEAFGVPFSQTVTGQISSSVLNIPINFYETRNDIVIELGLPGYAREDVEVSITGRRLRLIAKPRASEGFLESKVYSHNFAHVNLDREIELPEYLDASNAQVSMNDGLLRVIVQRLNTEEKKLTISEHTDQYLRDEDGA